MESSNHSHDDGSCCNCKSGNSARQTLSELDFERGIWYAAQTNDLDRVKSLLNKGTSPDVEDAAGYTALHYAARNGHDKVCKELLYRGANVNAVTRSGKATALHRAATQKHVHIVELLLKANADANIQDADGFTALHRSITSDCDPVSKLLIPKTKLDLMDKSECTPRQLAEQKGKTNLFF
ncbi:ankyrin repeat domain-containing protein 39 [Nasonia vitripennis]|uniref:Ankyrin repeat domain-containing protein 39 n=1 Tax=Nasonia vitripennis TaxID=7425 RepID=A0A7M7TCC4_NASVI|nr:ankyrin repeat domain-containing protein 39 [Nasonia vitripennis]XP_032453138.1 ankyrin repeat domain-containing protein 39 [Nasonia vitripennis]XP_032453139.1 ankyrin repeat domain-containing protein 39 [Nasonia vitripennis]